MYKIIHSTKSINKIDIFTKSYKNSFTKLFEDSWLFMVEEIINDYIKLWNRLHDLVYSNIESIFIENTIFWISKTKTWTTFTTISINNFRLFIYYAEISDEKLRIIEDIEFFRK
jgi:hypothetical protein